ncbi:hypothetical protein OQJ62_06260 [Microbulbifer thermotolerans]|uniref:hypothetical protein n=1 Tax=Microbulbifer thermotolerans TaxID=252514 RepID=UPI002248B87D|nr:hypothetical protein [Microbulbifer thermotolerans]MCX2794525.1 hypothetical protein [Microbulbifer thermotolerans]
MRIIPLILILCSSAAVAASNFYANPQLQRQMPRAFALQPEAQSFLQPAFRQTQQQGDALVSAIRKDQQLEQAISQWPNLTIEEQIPHLKRLFKLEAAVMGIEPPTLLIDNHSYPDRTVYFDFDPEAPSTGTVYLNPDKLAERDKFDSLAFLIHETRHSYQFQRAFSTGPEVDDPITSGYANAFKAQKSLKRFSFSDFLTLLNEYEAFQFGNYVIGRLTGWKVQMPDMGTFASQFDSEGNLKIDLIQLSEEVSELSLLERYNLLAKEQYEMRQSKQ